MAYARYIRASGSYRFSYWGGRHKLSRFNFGTGTRRKFVGLVWRCPVVSGLVSHAPLAARGRAALHELVMAVTDVSCDASLAAISRPRPLVSSSAAVCSRRPAEPQLRRCMMGLAWTTMPSAGAALAPGPGKLAAAAGKLSSKEAESSDRTAASPSAACTQW